MLKRNETWLSHSYPSSPLFPANPSELYSTGSVLNTRQKSPETGCITSPCCRNLVMVRMAICHVVQRAEHLTRVVQRLKCSGPQD